MAARKKIATPSTVVPASALPPFGDIPSELIGAIASFPTPEGYVSGDGRPAGVAWPEHYRLLVNRLSDTLWPRWGGYAGGTPGWTGGAARGMKALTILDLALTTTLTAQFELEVSQRDAAGPSLACAERHRVLFEQEDPGTKGGLYPVLSYLPSHDRVELERAAGRRATALGIPAGEASLPIRLEYWSYSHPTAPTLPSKRELQRPRPHQVASLWGRPLAYRRAPGAVTSALPSGHAIQGLMGVCAALIEMLPYASFDDDLLSRLRQYAVDVGDRRVFAGVHYPCDNLASWCIALSLCHNLYGQYKGFAHAFMAQSITRHSAVYAALQSDGSRILKPGLDWLDELLQPPV